MSRPQIVVVAPHWPGWRWHAAHFPEVDWHFFDDEPASSLESRVRKPNLARLRSCAQAAWVAKRLGARAIFSHEPLQSAYTASFASRLCPDVPHIAVSFNYAELPRGPRLSWQKRAFSRLSRFIVYSSMERELYAKTFGVPLERFETLLWSVSPPVPTGGPALHPGRYVCAIGGNARDYRTLITAARALPHVSFALVARPHNLIGLDPPGNVHVFTNIPYTDAMNVLAHSEFMVLPLASSEVPCGHVTLVAAMHLGKAFVITNSQGVADYVKHGENALAVPHADSGALAQAIEELWGAPERARTMGHRGLEFAQQFCSEARAVRHLRSTLVELGVLPSAAESGVREAAPAQSAP